MLTLIWMTLILTNNNDDKDDDDDDNDDDGNGDEGFWVDSILDPETEAVLRDMDGLNADFDLDDTDSN